MSIPPVVRVRTAAPGTQPRVTDTLYVYVMNVFLPFIVKVRRRDLRSPGAHIVCEYNDFISRRHASYQMHDI
jgi:hypothetical protein